MKTTRTIEDEFKSTNPIVRMIDRACERIACWRIWDASPWSWIKTKFALWLFGCLILIACPCNAL